MDDIVFGDLPPSRSARNGRGPLPRTVQAAATLRANPGQWAELTWLRRDNGAATGGAVNGIKSGKSAWAPAGAFEAVTRSVDGAQAQVWARYVGEVTA